MLAFHSSVNSDIVSVFFNLLYKYDSLAYYVDFFRCKELMGDDYEPCKFFQNVYRDICPSFWVDKWDEYREEGRFPAKFDR